MRTEVATRLDPTKLAIVKVIHTAIYVLMATATVYVLIAGITGHHDVAVWVAIGLVGLEGAVFFGSGMRCPLTTLARKYGDPTGHVGDTLFPEALTRYTFRAFGTLYVVGLLLILARTLLQ